MTLHTAVPTPTPLRTGDSQAFTGLRAFLRAAAYTEEEICRRVDIPSLNKFCALRDGRAGTELRDAADALIHLFLDNEPLEWARLTALVPPQGLDALVSLGLVRDHRWDPSRAVAAAMLYPAEGLYVASDVAVVPDDPDNERWWDLVYAAITTNTRTFLSMMPRTPCDTFLDLCSGTGIAGLVAASRFARHAWLVDIADRSTDFARFNTALNAVANVTALTGDLYDAVEGLTFDRIAAHPPYVPARETTVVYRDGGSDGEQVTRRIVEGLPRYLRPGGSFHCTCTATDRRDAPVEARVRAMLGAAADEFDIAVVVGAQYDPTEYYVRQAVAGRVSWAEAEEWHHHFRALGAVRIVYATIAIVRHRVPHPPYTVRRRAGSATGHVELSRLAEAAEAAAPADALDRLLDSRPLVAAHVVLQAAHVRDGAGWAVRDCRLEASVPLDVSVPCPPGLVPVVGRMDGTRSVRELYAELARDGAVNDAASIDHFASFLHLLAAHGLVDLHDP